MRASPAVELLPESLIAGTAVEEVLLTAAATKVAWKESLLADLELAVAAAGAAAAALHLEGELR